MRILIIVAIVLFVVIWAGFVLDALRRPDLGVGAKLAWAVAMLVLPLLGILVYLLLKPSDAQIQQNARR
jgi:hypothetical protein